MSTRSFTVTEADIRRIARSTDRLDPDTGRVLTEHEAMERLVGLEAAVAELERQIGAKKSDIKVLTTELESRLAEIRALIRIPTPKDTPLFDEE